MTDSKRRNKIIQTTSFRNPVQGWIFTITRGNEVATLKTKRGSFQLKQSSYDSKLYRGCANAYDVQIRVEQGLADLSYKPTVH